MSKENTLGKVDCLTFKKYNNTLELMAWEYNIEKENYKPDINPPYINLYRNEGGDIIESNGIGEHESTSLINNYLRKNKEPLLNLKELPNNDDLKEGLTKPEESGKVIIKDILNRLEINPRSTSQQVVETIKIISDTQELNFTEKEIKEIIREYIF